MQTKISCSCSLVKVSVRYWRGQKKLKPEDIGLNSDNLSDRLIRLGHKRLLSKDATATVWLIEGRADALMQGNTFPFLNGLGHFLPNRRLNDVMDKVNSMIRVLGGKVGVHHEILNTRASASK